MTDGGSRGRTDLLDALHLVRASSRGLAKQALARYSCDVLTWPFREEFASIWRTVDFIPGWFTEGSAAVLYSIMRSERPKTVVEIGSYLGRSTVFFALTLRQVAPGGRVVAIDPHTGDRQQLEGLSAERLPTFELFQQHCRAANVEDVVSPRVATSQEAAAGWSGSIDLLFVDGWHSYEAVISDGTAWLPYLSAAGVVVFDDYWVYEEVHRAVHDLAAAGKFHLWGAMFGQAIGGAREKPPPAVARALLLTRGGITQQLRSWVGRTR